jgi:hypothetical protein
MWRETPIEVVDLLLVLRSDADLAFDLRATDEDEGPGLLVGATWCCGCAHDGCLDHRSGHFAIGELTYGSARLHLREYIACDLLTVRGWNSQGLVGHSGMRHDTTLRGLHSSQFTVRNPLPEPTSRLHSENGKQPIPTASP